MKNIFNKENMKKILNKIPYKKINIWLGIILVLGFIVGILYDVDIGAIIMIADIYLFSIMFFIYSIKNMIDDIDKVILLVGFVFVVFMVTSLLGQVISWYVPKFFKANQDNMFQLFINSFSNIIPAFLGVFGSYLGAVYGGNKAIEATERQLAKQEEYENKKRKEDEKYINSVILNLIKFELEVNYSKVWISSKKPDGGNRAILFKEYDQAKYILLQNPSPIVKEINKMYMLFKEFSLLDLEVKNDFYTDIINRIAKEKSILDEMFNNLEKHYNELI